MTDYRKLAGPGLLADLGCHWVGLNVEAKEAANVNGITPEVDQAQRFWRDTFEWAAEHPDMTIREIDNMAKFLSYDAEICKADGRHDLIPTISWNGDVVLLSPELLGVRDKRYNEGFPSACPGACRVATRGHS
ncbi:hypothetical protein [Actinokineospora cianjurensis]|uniref:hypothetical protein n=1 Tax=Actinokineospora cianjurensis TaxID=585224 RepID=UPI000EB2CAA6|nr:hypothetical protein [Actinokineospora cianjurensis]